MNYIKAILYGYASYEMWQIPADLWHKLSIVAGVLALLNLFEGITKYRIVRKEK